MCMNSGFERLQLFWIKLFKEHRDFWPPVLVSSKSKSLLLQSDFNLGCYYVYFNINLFLGVNFIFQA